MVKIPKPDETWYVAARVQKPGTDGEYVDIRSAWTKTKQQALRKAKEFLAFFKRKGYKVIREEEDQENVMTIWYLQREVDGKTLNAKVNIVGVPF